MKNKLDNIINEVSDILSSLELDHSVKFKFYPVEMKLYRMDSNKVPVVLLNPGVDILMEFGEYPDLNFESDLKDSLERCRISEGLNLRLFCISNTLIHSIDDIKFCFHDEKNLPKYTITELNNSTRYKNYSWIRLMIPPEVLK